MPDTDVSERKKCAFVFFKKYYIKKNKGSINIAQVRSAVFHVFLVQDENMKAIFVTKWYVIGWIYLYSDSLRASSPLFSCL